MNIQAYILAVVLVGCPALATPVSLGAASAFSVLAGSAVTNTGPSVIAGDLGVSPGTSITGFPPGLVAGGVHGGDAVAAAAQVALTSAYIAAAALPCAALNDLTGTDLGGLTLIAGVYCFDSSAALTGTLTLDAAGDPLAEFVFQIGSTLTTASGSAVTWADVESPHVIWLVGSSATLGTATAFRGNILAQASITLTTGASIACGSALARDGAVTLDTNSISGCTAVPEPGTWKLLIWGLVMILLTKARR